MNEEEFIQDILLDAMYQTEEIDAKIISIRGFQDAMLLTNDQGVIVKLASGEEFQVTVRRSV